MMLDIGDHCRRGGEGARGVGEDGDDEGREHRRLGRRRYVQRQQRVASADEKACLRRILRHAREHRVLRQGGDLLEADHGVAGDGEAGVDGDVDVERAHMLQRCQEMEDARVAHRARRLSRSRPVRLDRRQFGWPCAAPTFARSKCSRFLARVTPSSVATTACSCSTTSPRAAGTSTATGMLSAVVRCRIAPELSGAVPTLISSMGMTLLSRSRKRPGRGHGASRCRGRTSRANAAASTSPPPATSPGLPTHPPPAANPLADLLAVYREAPPRIRARIRDMVARGFTDEIDQGHDRITA
jgi:hypothetical protein